MILKYIFINEIFCLRIFIIKLKILENSFKTNFNEFQNNDIIYYSFVLRLKKIDVIKSNNKISGTTVSDELSVDY